MDTLSRGLLSGPNTPHHHHLFLQTSEASRFYLFFFTLSPAVCLLLFFLTSLKQTWKWNQASKHGAHRSGPAGEKKVCKLTLALVESDTFLCVCLLSSLKLCQINLEGKTFYSKKDKPLCKGHAFAPVWGEPATSSEEENASPYTSSLSLSALWQPPPHLPATHRVQLKLLFYPEDFVFVLEM